MTQPKSKPSTKSKKAAPATAKKRAASTKAAAKPAEALASPAKAPVAAKAEVLAAPVKAPVAAKAEVLPAPVKAAAPARLVTRAEFMLLVRREAYRMAARRDFKNGSPFQDWVNAEAAVQGQLKAQGVQLS